MRFRRPVSATARRAVLLVLIAAAGLAPSAWASPGLRVTGMTFVGSTGSRSNMVVRAERAFFQPDTEMADLEQVRAEVSDDVEGESFRMTCDNAELNVETNDFEAKGNVQGVTGEGQHYSAPWVKYDHATAMLYTDASVLVVDDSVTLRGEGFRYYIDDRHFELLGNVTVEQAR